MNVDRYHERLLTLPAPGGNGCHVALLGVADLGVMAGMAPQQVFEDIRRAVPPGKRPVPDREIWDAVRRAVRDHETGPLAPHTSTPEPALPDAPMIRQGFIDKGAGAGEADFHDASDINIDWPPEEDAPRILSYLYRPDDLPFIGDRTDPGLMGATIRPTREWGAHFGAGGQTFPHAIPNPLTGEAAPKKGGDGLTLRGDACVADFRYCTVEFDDLDRDSQLAFWAAVDLPICALIDSGGKSIHAWLDVRRLAEVRTLEEWDLHIRDRLYKQTLIPLGVDSACSNPSRLSRLPGHFRTEKGKWQRLLYLSPKGRKIF